MFKTTVAAVIVVGALGAVSAPAATKVTPMPTATPKLYGQGYINGTIIGIPKNGKHTDAAWALTKWLTTDTHALAMLSNGLRNVPSTTESTAFWICSAASNTIASAANASAAISPTTIRPTRRPS